MINWALFEAIELINPAIFGDERDEMGIASSFNTGLSFVDSLLVFIMNFLAVFEDFGSGFTVLIAGPLTEFV